MEFLLMNYVLESGWGQLTKAQQEQGMAVYLAYTESLAKAGVLKMNRRLAPSASAHTVRLKDGKAQVLDGPYVDAKEQLGGFYIIDVADREAALAWAAKCPAVGHGVVEVREMPAR
ncbi:MAG TPA: YciI family protein [Candidatus Sulfotelmatobacter sp.]|nr:YciI family protein [Candidatus Sulfotelmatobacter sp.]